MLSKETQTVVHCARKRAYNGFPGTGEGRDASAGGGICFKQGAKVLIKQWATGDTSLIGTMDGHDMKLCSLNWLNCLARIPVSRMPLNGNEP